jgi:hypothetical protein
MITLALLGLLLLVGGAGVFFCSAVLLSRHREEKLDRQMFAAPVRRLRR